MKECLKCGKEFQEKKETAKFCSTSCRVMYNRKKVDKAEKMQGKVVLNQILDAMDEFKTLIKSANINYVQPPASTYDNHNLSKTWVDELGQWEQPTTTRKPKSVIKYVSERLQIETPEQFELWSEELESDPFLSDRDKKDARIKIL